MTRKFWAYKHVNGTVHLKNYRDPDAIEDAFESDFVADVMNVFEAENRAKAEEKARAYFAEWTAEEILRREG